MVFCLKLRNLCGGREHHTRSFCCHALDSYIHTLGHGFLGGRRGAKGGRYTAALGKLFHGQTDTSCLLCDLESSFILRYSLRRRQCCSVFTIHLRFYIACLYCSVCTIHSSPALHVYVVLSVITEP